jgi:hypothetical protein
VWQLSHLRGHNFNLLNSTNIVLLPKKDTAESVGDFRPISLVQGIAKNFSKILALRLAPRLPELVSSNQSAFVQKRCIHDNFVLVQSIVKDLHRRKTPALFFKLDIAKAFDSVSWAYLLEVLDSLGFGPRWREWISISLATSSSQILLNGSPGRPIKHECGLRQGDPISPMLIILVIDPLQRILQLVAEGGVLHPITSRSRGIKASLYDDDAAIFVRPRKQDIAALKEILSFFGEASGLCINLQKNEVFSISCDGADLDEILEGFPAAVKSLPCRYLRLPLHLKILRWVDFLPLLDKVGGKLPGWKVKLMNMVARAQLVKSVVTSIVTYHVMIFPSLNG